MDLFGSRVIAYVGYILECEGHLIQYDRVLMKGDFGHRCAHNDNTMWRLEWCCHKPRNPYSSQKLEEPRKDSPLVSSEGSWPFGYLDFGCLSLRTLREYILLFYVTQLVVICHGSTRRLTYPLLVSLPHLAFCLRLSLLLALSTPPCIVFTGCSLW